MIYFGITHNGYLRADNTRMFDDLPPVPIVYPTRETAEAILTELRDKWGRNTFTLHEMNYSELSLRACRDINTKWDGTIALWTPAKNLFIKVSENDLP